MRVMDWNIEHMNSWWTSDNPPGLRQTFAGNSFSPAVTDVPNLATRVGAVINAVNPDLIAMQESAGVAEMQDFFNRFVEGDWTILRGSGGAQSLAIAARQGGAVTNLVTASQKVGSVDLTAGFDADVDADMEIEHDQFARVPQVVEFTAHNLRFMIVNNHLKSKFVSGGEADFNAGGERRQNFFRQSLRARRRISAEAFRIRQFLDALFDANPLALLLVTGDLNDGEGADFFEQSFLTHSVVDRVFGSVFRSNRRLAHVLFDGGSTDFTAEFFDFMSGRQEGLVLDHIGLSPAVSLGFRWRGRVAVAEFESQRRNEPGLAARDRAPSDHRPVVADINPI